ncbi:choline/ethanolamine kinase isoform X1 [Calliphora vicina]|uniref:choline/ethanolamine kinase isoform X1 n=1 Tax=Calliphora vicina TaxID=7373 RepID=UPI00325BACCA
MKQCVARKVGKKPISHDRVWQLFGPQATLEEIRHAASRICRDYLNGRWKVVPAEQLIVKRISGGLSNFLYYVSLPTQQDNANEAADYQRPQAMETALDRATATALLTAVDDENRNEPHYNELVGDMNGNKRKRYDSASSASSAALRQNEPEEVLLRIYGQSHGEDALEAMITESVVFALLSERHFGPKLHGIFPGGRIEQYIPARALLTTELSDAKISVKIAEKMGEIHGLNIPMSKEPDWIWNCMNRWQRHLPAILSRNDWQENQSHAEFVRNFNFAEESKWLKSVIDNGQYPVLFCHNDFQEGNILLRSYNTAEETNLDDSLMDTNNEEGDLLNNKRSRTLDLDSSADSALCSSADSAGPDLMIIDFEYCAYNYRGFDLANHFLEWTFDYSNPVFPFYYHHKQQFPNIEQRQKFIKSYLKRLNESEDDWEPTQKEIDDVENEIKLFKMFSHLFWSLWSVVNVTSNIEFGYWDYAITRINEYLQLKQNFIADNNPNV